MMRSILRFCFSVVVFLSCTAHAASTPAEHLAGYLQHLQTFQADFVQHTYTGKRHHALSSMRGKVWIKKPGRFRWEINTPYHQILILNGNTFWTIDKDLQQKTHQTIAQANATHSPAALLSGDPKVLTTQYRIQLTNDSTNLEEHFLLTPQAKPSPFQSIELVFKLHILSEMVMKNQLMQTTVYQFSQIQRNQLIQDRYFQVK